MLVAVKRFNKSAWPDSHQFLVHFCFSIDFNFAFCMRVSEPHIDTDNS